MVTYTKEKSRSYRKVILYCTIAVYTYILLSIIVFKNLSSPIDLLNPYRSMIRSVNLIPFEGIWMKNVSARFNITSIVGNIALFVPLGIYITMFTQKYALKVDAKIIFIKNTTIIFLISLFLEVFQYIFSIGVSDINDVILNLLGGILGIVIYKSLRFMLREEKTNDIILTLGATIATIVLAIDFSIRIFNA